nr:CtsR family transcriptional regulator [Clostridia bacterium]
MGISDNIAELIEKLIEEGNGNAEIRRNDLALRIGCVPSQINYVITSRFTPERGYVIESRRGGGGYIRITRKALHKSEYLMHMFASVGTSIDLQSSEALVADLLYGELISAREAKLITVALRSCASDEVRAVMFRQMILTLI